MTKAVKLAFLASLVLNLLLLGVILGKMPRGLEATPPTRQQRMEEGLKKVPEPTQSRLREKFTQMRVGGRSATPSDRPGARRDTSVAQRRSFR